MAHQKDPLPHHRLIGQFGQVSGGLHDTEVNRLACFTIGEPPLLCPLAVVYKKNGFLSPAARAFIDLIRTFYRQAASAPNSGTGASWRTT